MKNKNTFNNFVDFGSYIQKTKEHNKQLAFEKLSKGVFVETLDHLTHEQITKMIPTKDINDADYVFEKRKDIVFESFEINNYNYRDCFSAIYSINIEPINKKITLIQNFEITTNGFNNSLQLETFGETYLKKEFVEKYKSNNYKEQDDVLIQLYKKLFNNITVPNQMIPHVLKKKSFIVVNDNIEYITEYELYIRKKIHAGLSKMLLKIASTTLKKDDNFIEKLTSLLENDYTLPLLDKKLVDLNEDDITVLKMSLI